MLTTSRVTTRLHAVEESWIARGNTNRLRLNRANSKVSLGWDANGETALHVAARAGDHGAVVRFLKKFGDPSHAVCVKDREARCTPLHVAAEWGRTEIARVLVHAGGAAALMMLDAEGALPVHYAIAGGHVECLRALLEAHPHASLSHKDRDGDGLLSYAVRFEQTACVRVLTSVGADACASNREGRTALHCAAKRGLVEAVRSLLEAGADPTAVDRKGDTPLSDATRQLDATHSSSPSASQTARASSSSSSSSSSAPLAPHSGARDGGGCDSFQVVVELLRTATNEVCGITTSKQLLYVPLTPSVANGRAANTSADANDAAASSACNPRRRRLTPTTRARGMISEAFAPGSDHMDCSICLVPVILRPMDGEEAEQAAITACGHVYHLSCWQQMVAFCGERGVACPNCRDGLTLKHAKGLSPPTRVATPHAPPAEARPPPLSTTPLDVNVGVSTPPLGSTPGRSSHSGSVVDQSRLRGSRLQPLTDCSANATRKKRAKRFDLSGDDASLEAEAAGSSSGGSHSADPIIHGDESSMSHSDRGTTDRRNERARGEGEGQEEGHLRPPSSSSAAREAAAAAAGTATARRAHAPLASLSRKELQARAKAAGVAANLKTIELISRLEALHERLESSVGASPGQG
jgi:hypothetical protein